MVKCPPWKMAVGKPLEGIFPMPPKPSTLKKHVSPPPRAAPLGAAPRALRLARHPPSAPAQLPPQALGAHLAALSRPSTPSALPPPPLQKDLIDDFKELLAVYPVITINMALCERHRKACPAGPQLAKVCDPVEEAWQDLKERADDLEDTMTCADFYVRPWLLFGGGVAGGL
jgi:hypothetical protein